MIKELWLPKVKKAKLWRPKVKKPRGRQPWPLADTILKIENVFTLITVWTKKCEHEDNQYIPAWKPLKIAEAMLEVWMEKQNFFSILRKNPDLKDKYKDFREVRRELIKDRAEDNLDRAIWGKMNIEDVDLANLSLKYLEKTDKAYNPKTEIAVTSQYVDMTEEELKEKILELMNS